ncbi:MAG: hypothetical protein HKO01_03040 [Flaviramulus sp.]|nr:hypothetical protein [Flaviramulus sp.]NNC49491.1 hypothetical protein [Flaviramulus sp.]
MKKRCLQSFKKTYLLTALFFILCVASNVSAINNYKTKKPFNNKGLFSIQFSWNSDSYSKNLSVEVSYKKDGFLKKTKKSGATAFKVSKNQFINIELPEGDYELLAINLSGPDFPAGKYLRIPFEHKFKVISEQITNGGLVYIIRENKQAHNVMNLKINNDEDLKRFMTTYRPEFASNLDKMTHPWPFLSNEKVDKLIISFADLLVKREGFAKRPKVNYLYASLGMIIKMEKNAEGKVLSYKLLPTPTYQQIKKMVLKKGGKILCDLENDSFLYGTDEGLEYIPLPEALEKSPILTQLKNGDYIMHDRNLNIFTSDDSFNWKAHLEFNQEFEQSFFQARSTSMKIYEGKDNLYFYTTGIGKNKKLLRSPHSDYKFENIEVSKDILKIPMVTETSSNLVIGPVLKLNASAKRPAYIYVKEKESQIWEERALPFGDCYGFAPDRNDDTIFFTKCTESEWHQSKDGGKTWVKYETNTVASNKE